MISVHKADDLLHHLDKLTHCSHQRSVTDHMLEAFTAISQDNPSIHRVDAGFTVIPGNLLISLMPAMLQSGLRVEKFDHCKTVAIAKVRFINSAGLNEQLSLQFKVTQVRRMRENCFVTTSLLLTAEDGALNVLSAEQTDCYVD